MTFGGAGAISAVTNDSPSQDHRAYYFCAPDVFSVGDSTQRVDDVLVWFIT